MKKLLIAVGAIGAMVVTATPAAAQRYGRSHSSFSVTVGTGYGSPYSYGSPYGYGYAPSYGYSPYAYDYSQPTYYPSEGYDSYYGRSYEGYDRRAYSQRRHRHHQRDSREDRDDRHDNGGREYDGDGE